jgi:hypothetical protein
LTTAPLGPVAATVISPGTVMIGAVVSTVNVFAELKPVAPPELDCCACAV